MKRRIADLHRIAQAVLRAHPAASTRVREETQGLDLQIRGRWFVVNYSPKWGFCVDELREFEHPFDDFYRHVEPTADGAIAKLLSLIRRK